MSEFKFACPVCGQHITADSNAAGSQLSCPTCFRKIVVPQAPASADPKFILSAVEADKPRRPRTEAPSPGIGPGPSRSRTVPILVAVFLVLAGAGGATVFVLREKIFEHNGNARAGNMSLKPGMPSSQRHGAIGLGAWNTAVEYSNVVVRAGTKALYQSDFSSGHSGWRIRNGSWTATNGVFRQSAVAVNCRAETGDPAWSNYVISLRARKLGGREGFLILFNVRDDRNYTWWNVGGWDNTRHAVENCVSGTKTTMDRAVPGQIERGRWYDVRVELDGRRIRCYLDNTLVQDVTYPPG